jgi:hypothetical protein
MGAENTAMGASTGNPWLIGAGIAADVAGSIWGGEDEQQQMPPNLHLVNPGQQALWNMFAQRAKSGAGEFGFGQAAKQGKSQVQNFLADRGVDMGSGFAAGAMGDAFANAAAQDSANRNQFNLSLLNTPLQVAQTAGANFIPGSTSTGADVGEQRQAFAGGTGYGPYQYTVPKTATKYPTGSRYPNGNPRGGS